MLSAAEESLSLTHVQRLTDDFGMVQHANYAVPNYRYGYAADDNARALALAAHYHDRHGGALSRRLAARYLSFQLYAQRADGRFHNFIGADRRSLDEVGSEDCFGRSLWGAACVLSRPPDPNLIAPAEAMFQRALPWAERLEHARAKAWVLLALCAWIEARPEETARAASLAHRLGRDLLALYRANAGPSWDWLLPDMTYDNAKLPEGLFRAYQLTGDEAFRRAANATLAFLYEKTLPADRLAVVGNKGWFRRGQRRPPEWDQQPVDAAAMVEACVAAYEVTGDADHLRRARLSLAWFHGCNLRGESLHNAETDGCFDGLMRDGVNRSQGAESTLALHLAHLTVWEMQTALARETAATGELRDAGRREEGRPLVSPARPA